MVFLSAVEGIRDIKGPVYFSVNFLPLIIILCLFTMIGTFFLIRYILKKMKEKEEDTVLKVRPPREVAYEALEALKAKNLPSQGKVKEFYYELSLIVRHYIEDRFNIKAPEMTTEEFLFALQESETLSGTHRNHLKEFLNLCDIVKFAKYGPTQKETDDSFNAAKRFVDETKPVEDEAVLVR